MNLKKALTYIAVGFAFTLININLVFNGNRVSVTPDFIGWILLYLSYKLMGDYVADKPILKWGSLVLIILSLATWLQSIFMPEISSNILTTISNFAGAVYIYVLLGVLVKVSKDYDSSKTKTIEILRIIHPIVYIILAILSIVLMFISNPTSEAAINLGVITVAVLFVTLALALVTMFSLFGLRKDILSKIE